MKKRIFLTAVFLLICACLALFYLPQPVLSFRLLQLYSGRPDKARKYADRLRQTKDGLREALASDLSCLKNSTDGWASWIILTTPFTNEAVSGLANLARMEEAVPLSTEIEIHRLLWKLTNEKDHLLHIFSLVRHSGGPAVWRGRRVLGENIDDPLSRRLIEIESSKELHMTSAEYINMLDGSDFK